MFKKRKIDYLIIGAQKSGTTSLYEYLTAHPKIDAANKKEIHYFDANHDKGKNWYHLRFPWTRGHLQGEATPYYLFHDACPKLVKKYNSKVKLIVILRNPVDRAFSQYRMNVKRGDETLPFVDALHAEEKRLMNASASDPQSVVFSYKKRGLYAEQLDRWLKHFSKEQLMILEYEHFFKNPWIEIQKVYRFLGLSEYEDELPSFESNKNIDNMTLSEDAKTLLRRYFAGPNKTLTQQYNINFEE